MAFKLSPRSYERLQGVDPRIIEIVENAILISRVDFGIPRDGGLRTAERQNEMFRDPEIATNCDGYENQSYHQTGLAFDVYGYVNGKASWREEHLSLVACAILQSASMLGYSLEWGGHWESFVDSPHFQLTDDVM